MADGLVLLQFNLAYKHFFSAVLPLPKRESAYFLLKEKFYDTRRGFDRDSI